MQWILQMSSSNQEIGIDRMEHELYFGALHGIVGNPREDWYRIRVKT